MIETKGKTPAEIEEAFGVKDAKTRDEEWYWFIIIVVTLFIF